MIAKLFFSSWSKHHQFFPFYLLLTEGNRSSAFWRFPVPSLRSFSVMFFHHKLLGVLKCFLPWSYKSQVSDVLSNLSLSILILWRQVPRKCFWIDKMHSVHSLHWPVTQRVNIYKDGRCITWNIDFSSPNIIIIDALDSSCFIHHTKAILEKVLPESRAGKSTSMIIESIY